MVTSSNRSFRRFQDKIKTREKRYTSMPAVKIGRFAVSAKMQSTGIGSKIMDGIKYDFINGNKTGCRFIVVDAYNKPGALNFYKKNGFEFLIEDGSDLRKDTRIMYYDLIKYRE